jgi:hypothetical protein
MNFIRCQISTFRFDKKLNIDSAEVNLWYKKMVYLGTNLFNIYDYEN